MPTRARWVEPARSLPLHWGRYEDRYLWGLILIVGGGLHLQASNTYTVPFLLSGTVATVVGWSILPGGGGRRIAAALLGTAMIWLLLTGPQAMWTFLGLFLAWLIVRHRPARSYVTLLFPLANAFAAPRLFEEYRWMPVALGISLAVVVGSAWLARVIAVGGARSRTSDSSDQ